MKTARAYPSAVRYGLALGGLYGWMLSFPMFGPLLFAQRTVDAPILGLLFVLLYSLGLVTFTLLPQAIVTRTGLIHLAGWLLALFTILAGLLPDSAEGLRLAALLLMALPAAFLLHSWAPLFNHSPDPISTLVTTFGTAHTLVAGGTAAQGLIPGQPLVGLALSAGMVLAGATAIARSVAELRSLTVPAGRKRPDRQAPLDLLTPLLPGVAFALGAFLVGGLWYLFLAQTPGPDWQWRPVAEGLIYALGVILFGEQARSGRPGMVALYSLSLLGLAILTAIAGNGGTGELATLYRALFLLGLAGATLFYWHYLWRVREIMGMRRTLGWGLWLSLTMVALTNTAAFLWPVSRPPGTLLLLIGAGLLFCTLPLASREPRLVPAALPQVNHVAQPVPSAVPTPHEAAGQSQLVNRQSGSSQATDGVRPLEPPPGLTQSERQVYDLLIKGASDAEIAAALFITRHTVKFHVRNILHKVGVENRKELLSRLVAGGGVLTLATARETGSTE